VFQSLNDVGFTHSCRSRHVLGRRGHTEGRL
jgi:hypothetical protein